MSEKTESLYTSLRRLCLAFDVDIVVQLFAEKQRYFGSNIMALNQPAEAYGGELAVEYNLYKSLAHGVTEYAQNAAVICMHQPKAHLAAFTSADLTAILVERPKERRFLRWSHQDLCTAAQNVALGLQDRGVHRVGAMVTLIPNGVEWAVLMYASVILGLSFVPLDSGMVTRARAEELANLMRLLSPDVVVVAGREGALAVSACLGAWAR